MAPGNVPSRSGRCTQCIFEVCLCSSVTKRHGEMLRLLQSADLYADVSDHLSSALSDLTEATVG